MDLSIISKAAYSLVTTTFLGVQLWQYVLSILVIIISFPIKHWVEIHVIRNVLEKYARASGKYLELLFEAVHKPLGALVILAGIHLAILILSLDGALSWRFAQVLRYTYYFAITVIFVWTVYRLIEVFVVWYEDVCRARESGMQQFMPLIRQTLRIFIIIIGLITILSALDIDVGGFIAGLGIGGIAVALAAKDSLGNFFGSVGIIADRPFEVGDWVMIGSKWEGFVEEIGFRSTKIRTWPRTLLTIPNQALANEVIDNLSKMPKRRVKTSVGITYDTPLEKIEPFVEVINKILHEDPGVHKEFILVRFHQFGDSSLDILMIYFTIGIRGHDYYGTQQRVNLKIMQEMKKMGISMAFPSRSLYIHKQPQELDLH